MNNAVILCEAISNGCYYAKEIRKHGLVPIIVNPAIAVSSDYAALRVEGKKNTDPYEPLYLNDAESPEEVLEQVADYNILAVVAGSELGVPFADQLAAAFGLPGNNPLSSNARRDKNAMQAALANAGLRHIRGRAVQDIDAALAFARELDRWPLVVKPLASAATQGVHICQDQEALCRCMESLFQENTLFGSPNTSLLVQEYIEGREYVVNSVSRQGVHRLTDFWVYNKLRMGDAGNAYDNMRLFTRLEPGHRRIIQYACQVLTALDFSFGPSHMEIMVDAEGPVLIEVGARPMGGHFSEEILRECLGHYLVDHALTSYLDPAAFEQLLHSPYRPAKHLMIKLLIAPHEMVVNSVPALPLLHKLTSVRALMMDASLLQSRIPMTVDMLSSPGSLLLCHEDEHKLLEDYQLIRRIEANFFGMLLEERPFVPEFNREWSSLALERLTMHQNRIERPTALIIDDGAEAPASAHTILPLSRAGEIQPPVDIIVHCGNRVMDFAAYFTFLEGLVEKLTPGNCLVVTPWGMQGLEYGEAGFEILCQLFGLRLELPHPAFPELLIARKEVAQ